MKQYTTALDQIPHEKLNEAGAALGACVRVCVCARARARAVPRLGARGAPVLLAALC